MVKSKAFHKVISGILSVLLLVSMFSLSAFADNAVLLKDGTAKITADMTAEEVKAALFNALVENPAGKDAQALEWEYSCEGVNGLLKHRAYGSIAGFQSKKGWISYTHPAIQNAEDGVYLVRLKGTQTGVKLTKSVKDIPNTVLALHEVTAVLPLYLKDDLSVNYARFKEDLFRAVYDAEHSAPADLTADAVELQYNASRAAGVQMWQNLDFHDFSNAQKPLTEGGEFQFRMILPETERYFGTTVTFRASVKEAERIESVLTLTDSTYTYTSDTAALEEAMLNTLIDRKNSVLPSQDKYGSAYYTVEYYAESTKGGLKRWVPLEGGTFALLHYPAIGAGEKQIRITFKGNSTHTSAAAEQTVTIQKARTAVFVNSTSKFADEKLPKNFVTTSSKDAFEIFSVFFGTTTSATGNLCIDLPDSITESAFIDLLNPIFKLTVGKSMDDIIENGITIAQLNAVLNSKALKDLAATLKIDLGAFGTLLDILENLPSSIQKFNIAFSEPKQAGFYNVVALAVNPNYSTGIGLGVLNVKVRRQDTALKFNAKLSGKISAEDAAAFDFGAVLTYQDAPVADQASVSYLYSGVQANGRPYSSTSAAPTAPGFYTQTVCVIGGNYAAIPMTRSFTIQ